MNDKSVDTYPRLLDIAAELFWAHSYAGTSTRMLSERIGLQTASLYHHIRQKEDLLYEISVTSLDQVQQMVMAAVTRAPRDERMRVLIHAHLTASLTDRDKHAVALTELRAMSPERGAAVRAKRDHYEATVVEIIRAEQDAGGLRPDVDPRFLTLALLNLMNWTIFWYRPDGDLTIDELAEHFTTLFLEGAQPQG